MEYYKPSLQLTDAAVLTMLQAAIAKASEMGQAQCIVIVDASGLSLVEFKMKDAKFLSLKSARAKAITAASTRNPSANIPDGVKVNLALATKGDVTGLSGGMPIVKDGVHIGGIGIGSGTGEQDIEVAIAALQAIDADI